ncbi:cysteine desulfurase family protein [Brachybacterium sp. DNPG3]
MVTVRTYLDHAATTVLRPAAREAFLEASSLTGNPSSIHTAGRAARGVLDDALERIGELLGVPASWLILTSGGTEADNLAVRGAARGVRAADPSRTAVAVAATEHPAVLAAADSLAEESLRADSVAADREHWDVRRLPVDAQGMLRADAVDAALADGTVALVSAALVNNETGALQDLRELAARARAHGALLHTDAVQAAGHVGLPRPGEEVDLLSLSGHKVGAPVGTGVLVADPDIPLVPLTAGGGQQRGVRSGTLDAAGAAALAAALGAALGEQEQEARRLDVLAERLRRGIRQTDPSARMTLDDTTPRSSAIVHAIFPGADTDALLFLLDQHRIDCSAGSACTAGVTQDSAVLAAMGIVGADARGALRLSLGWTSTEEDVDAFLAVLPDALVRARAVGSLSR